MAGFRVSGLGFRKPIYKHNYLGPSDIKIVLIAPHVSHYKIRVRHHFCNDTNEYPHITPKQKRIKVH
jgi:hypothetical protein